jgi:hypothetical protein
VVQSSRETYILQPNNISNHIGLNFEQTVGSKGAVIPPGVDQPEHLGETVAQGVGFVNKRASGTAQRISDGLTNGNSFRDDVDSARSIYPFLNRA